MKSRHAKIAWATGIAALALIAIVGIILSVRREIIERSLIWDAQLIYSYTHPGCREGGGPPASFTLAEICGKHDSISPGNTVRAAHDFPAAGAHAPQPPHATVQISIEAPAVAKGLPSRVFISNPRFDTANSSIKGVADPAHYPPGSQGLLFEIKTGDILDAHGNPLGNIRTKPGTTPGAWDWIMNWVMRLRTDPF